MNNNATNCGKNIYMYGMVVLSTIHKLVGAFPKLDTYGEIERSYLLPGGEAGNSAIVLRNLGYDVRLDGPVLGRKTREAVLSFYGNIGVDCSGMEYAPDFDGVEDLVIVADSSRTVFGRYGHYFSADRGRWSKPDEAAIASAQIVGLDPFFFEESESVANLCVRHAVPYVTIDCAPDSFLCRNATAVVVSHEYLENTFPGESPETLLGRYTAETAGLVILTFGGREILYGRRGTVPRRFRPYKVKILSTLGAGDTFRAGVMHGLLKGAGDREIVASGAAMAACVCRRFPVALTPPSFAEIDELIASEKA